MMTTKIKVKKEDLLIINNALCNPEVKIKVGEILAQKKIVEWYKSVVLEVWAILGKKYFTCSKTAHFEFYKHSADAFYWTLGVILEVCNLPIYEKIQIEKIKNELHQKKLTL